MPKYGHARHYWPNFGQILIFSTKPCLVNKYHCKFQFTFCKNVDYMVKEPLKWTKSDISSSWFSGPVRYILAYNLGLQKFLAEFFQKKKPSWSEFFCERSWDYYLSIDHEKSKKWCLFSLFDFFLPLVAGKRAWQDYGRGGKMGVAGKWAWLAHLVL